MTFQLCRAVEPNFATDSAEVYAEWLRKNRDAVAKFADEPWYKEELANYIGQERNSQYGRHNCNGLIEHLALSSKPPNPALSSSEKTWAVFITALLKADRATLFTCLVGTAQSKWKPVFEKLSDEELARMGNAITKISIDWGDDQMKSAWVTSKDGSVGSVAFVNVYGNWKISEM